MSPAETLLFTGLSSISLPMPKYEFPPQFQKSSRLTYYASMFNSIEINSSFYKIPQQRTVAKWHDEVPPGFRFSFKLFKEITHVKDLSFQEGDVRKFCSVIAAGEKKTAGILVQLPPGLTTASVSQLNYLLDCLRSQTYADPWSISVEFRNRAWYVDEVYEMLERYQANLVVHDIPKSATPLSVISGHVIYLRFHGPTGNYKGSYSEETLRDYAAMIRDWNAERKTVFVYFNNTNGAGAYQNLVTLNGLLKQ